MADQNIKVRVSSSNSSTRYFYVRVQTGEGDNGSSWISVGSTNSSGSQISSSEFSTSKLHTGGSYPSYQALQLWWSTTDLSETLSSSHQYNYQWPGSSSVYSAELDHPDNTYGSGTSISSSAYFLDITFPESDPSSTGWASWTQRNSSGTELDVTGPTSMTASFAGSTNTSIKLVFNESPRDSSGDKWTSSTVPGTSYSGFQWSPSDSAAITNFSVDSVTYSTTSVTDDTVTLGISYDGSVDSGETLSFTLSKAAVYDSNGNQAGSSGTFSSGTLSWPTTGASGRTYYDRTFKITNSSSGAVYFLIGVDYNEGTNGGSYVQRGPLAAGQTASYTVNQVLMNDFEYSSGGSFAIYPFSTDQSSNLGSSFYPSGTSAAITGAQLNAATDGRLEYTWDGSSWSGPTVYDTNGNLVDLSVATPTVTFANGSGSGTCTIDFGEKVYKSSSYDPSSFSDLSELTSSDVSSTYVSRSGGDTEVSSVSVTGVSYDTSDDSGAMAIYGTDNTGNSYGTGWFYPVYLSDPGSSHSHTFTQYSGTTFYMPNSGSNHAQSQPPAGYVHYHDQLVVSFTYSGTATTDDTMSIYFSSSNVFDANLNSGSLSISGAMQSDSSGGVDMSITKFNINKVSMNSDLKPDSSSNNRSLGTSSKKWKDAYLSDTLYLSATSKLSIADVAVTAGAAEINVLTGSGLAASDMSTLAGLALDGVTGLVTADFTKLAALTASAAEINYLASFADSTFAQASDSIVFWDADASAIRHETTAAFLGAVAGDGLTVASSQLAIGVDDSSIELDSDALRIKASGVTNAMLAGSIANAKLANSAVTITAGDGLSGGGSVSLGGSVSVALQVDDSSLEIDSDTARIKASGVTNAMLAGSIANAKLANSAVTVTAGDGLSGGGSVSLGGSVSVALQVDASSLEIDSDTARIKASGVTNAMLAGSIADGKLAADYVQTSEVDDSSIEFASGSLNIKASGVTNAMLAGSIADGKLAADYIQTSEVDGSSIEFDSGSLNIKAAGVTNAMLAGSIANAKLLNDSVTIGSTEVDLGASSTTLAGMTGIDFAAGDASIAASLGENTLTLGGATSTVSIAGDLQISGDLTTVSSTEVTIDDKAILLAAAATKAQIATASGAGLKLGGTEGSPHATFLYDGSDSFDASESMNVASGKDFQVAGTSVLSADGAVKVQSGVAGSGLNHAAGVLSADVDDSSIEIDGSDGLRVKASGITNAMLAGSIADGKLAADYIQTSEVDGSSIEFDSGSLNIKASGVTNAMLAGSIADGKLAADYIQTAEVDDSSIEFASGSLNIKAGGVTNAMLAGSIANAKLTNSAVTITAGDGLSGGGSVSLGGSVSVALQVDDSSLEIDSDTARIKASGVTNAMLAGSIANAKLANSAVTVTAGDGLSGGGSVSLGGSVSVALQVDDSSLEIDSDTARIKASGVTNAMLAGSIANAKLANSAVTVTAGDGLSGGGSVSLGGTVSLAVDMNELTAAEVDVANDSFMIIDATDNSSKKESVADLVDAMAGDGLVATNGVLSISPQQHYFMMSQSESSSNRALPEGSTAAGTASSGVRTLTVAIPSGGDYVTESLQVFCNGMLLRKDAGSSASSTYDYYCAATSGGSFVITLRADDDGDSPLFDDDDVVTVRYIKKD